MSKSVEFDCDKDFYRIGEFGTYQLLIFVLVGLIACIPGLIVYGYIFVDGTPEFRCQIPNLTNDTYTIQNEYHQYLVNKFIPVDSSDSKKYDKCHINVYLNESTLDEQYGNESAKKQKCDQWVFSNKFYTKTIVTDWELVCSKTAKKSTFSSLYFIGTYCILFIGIISDKYGRKLCAFGLIIANIIVNALVATLVNVDMDLGVKDILFGILRFLTGSATNTYSIAVVLAIEITGPKYRVMASNVIYYFFILGEFLAVLLCYFVRDYKNYFIWIAGIFCLYPLFFWMVPESPRWLITRGRKKEAYDILKKIARSNSMKIPENYEDFVMEKQKETKNELSMSENNNDTIERVNKFYNLGFLQTLYAFIKSKKLLIRTLTLTFNWLTNNLVYYGLTLGSGQMAGDPYLNAALLAISECAAATCSMFAYVKIGRKIPYIVNMAVTGVILLVVYFVPKSMTILLMIIALIGKFAVSFTFCGIYIVTSELYPTSIRQTCLSICLVIGKIGAIIAPYINLLGELYFEPLPFLIYGACAIFATILTFFFVPETKNRQLPNTIEDAD